jgi:hypothetical protein
MRRIFATYKNRDTDMSRVECYPLMPPWVASTRCDVLGYVVYYAGAYRGEITDVVIDADSGNVTQYLLMDDRELILQGPDTNVSIQSYMSSWREWYAKKKYDVAKKNDVNVAEKNGVNVAEKNGVNAAEKNGVNVAEKNGVNVAEKNGVNIAEKNGVNVTKKNGVNVTKKNDVSVAEKSDADVTAKYHTLKKKVDTMRNLSARCKTAELRSEEVNRELARLQKEKAELDESLPRLRELLGAATDALLCEQPAAAKTECSHCGYYCMCDF